MKPETCLIKNCNHDVQPGSSFCPEHHADWVRSGAPEVAALVWWLLQRQMPHKPRPQPRAPMSPLCLVARCSSDKHPRDLCPEHFGRWESLGRPEGDGFTAFLSMQDEMAMAVEGQ